MKQELTFHRDGNDHLLMLFAGWGMDATPFRELAAPSGYDIMVLWDYRDTGIDMEQIKGYGEIAVLGWSFGVKAAAHFLRDNPRLPITSRIAVNGTLYVRDDLKGIPTKIFDGTLENLDERNLTKFYRRMCGSSETFKAFPRPRRDIQGLKEELRAIAERKNALPVFDTAYMAEQDAIIPCSNQFYSWSHQTARRIIIDGPHMPDFQSLIRRILTDKPLVARRFASAAPNYQRAAYVQNLVVNNLLSLWKPGTANDVLEVGCGAGTSTAQLLQRITPQNLTLMDLHIDPAKLPAQARKIEGDAEVEIGALKKKSLDLIFSSSTMQWFNSIPAFLRRCQEVLRKDGQAVLSTYGDLTFLELRELCGIEKRFPTVGELAKMVPWGMEIEVLEDEVNILRFATPADLLRHVRATGVNALTPGMTPTQAARRILREYPRDDDGTYHLVYQPIYLILRKTK